MIELAVKLVLAYLLGSLSGSLMFGRLRGFDVREHGSGNAGGTNALRTLGMGFALLVMLVDVGKGVLAAAVLPAMPPQGTLGTEVLGAACGIAAILGHMYPIYFGFRGGKGAATFVGAAGALLPAALLPVVGLWLVVILLTGYVGLATMIAAIAFVGIVLWLATPEQWPTLLPFAVCGTSLILFAHRPNIQRLFDGTESRFDSVRIFHRRQ